MKKLSLFILVLMFNVSVFAQKEKQKAEMPAAKNCVKLNLTSLFFKNVGIQYERVLAPKISVACQVRLMPKGSLPMANSLDAAAGDSLDVSSIKVGSFAITPEFRFYPKHAMKGFYLAPYLRYRNAGLEAPLKYVDDNNANQSILMNGNLTSFGGGLMFGAHFNIGKMVSLDWFILGFQYMVSNGTLDAKTSVPLSASEQQDLRNELSSSQSDNKLFKYSYTVTANGATVSSKFGAIGLRGMGLNLGFRF